MTGRERPKLAGKTSLTCGFILERVTGIEPALSAWEADVLPLNYTRASARLSRSLPDEPALCSPRHRTGTGRLPGCSSPIVTSGPDRVRAGQARPVRTRADPAVQHRRPAGPVLPGLREPPLPAHRPRGGTAGPDQAGRDRGRGPVRPAPRGVRAGVDLRGDQLPDDVAGRLEGKSSLGRLGCSPTRRRAGSTRVLRARDAGAVQRGDAAIKLWPGMKIGQLCLFRTSSPAEHPYGSPVYGSRYQDQRGPTPSRSYLNFYRAKV